MTNHGGLSSSSSSCKVPLILPRPPSGSAPRFMNLGPISLRSSSSSAVGRNHALKVHSQAEKRRRERINAHLSTLRRMIPCDTSKMDKAALLGSVIEHVNDLKRKAADVRKLGRLSIPAEANEVVVEAGEADDGNVYYIKASLCCEDRPDLLVSLMKAFHGLRLRAVRADVTSLGGRARNVFVLCARKNHDGGGVGNASLGSLKESLKEALARIASFDAVTADASSSKRQRLLQSYYSTVSI